MTIQQNQAFYGTYAQNPYGQSVYANDPYGQTGYTGPTLYNYNNTGNASYGLYGNNPSQLFSESPYARMTGQTTSLSAAAIPNLATFMQPMTVDMNAFLGNTGIPRYASFIGATAMNNPETPLYTSYQQYQQQNPVIQPQIQQTYNYQQPYYQSVQNQNIFGAQAQQPIYQQQPVCQQQPAYQPQNNNFASNNMTGLMMQFITSMLGVFMGSLNKQQLPAQVTAASNLIEAAPVQTTEESIKSIVAATVQKVEEAVKPVELVTVKPAEDVVNSVIAPVKIAEVTKEIEAAAVQVTKEAVKPVAATPVQTIEESIKAIVAATVKTIEEALKQ